MKHQDGEFPIKFLGSGDYYWINHGRTFFYEDGDNERIPSMTSSKSMDASFKRGLPGGLLTQNVDRQHEFLLCQGRDRDNVIIGNFTAKCCRDISPPKETPLRGQ